RTIVRILAVFGGIIVLGGLLGSVSPHTEITTPAEHVIPKVLLSNLWFFQLVHVRFAQIQSLVAVGAHPVSRPAAPFPSANEWGSNFSLVVPYMVLAAMFTRRQLWRNLTWIL